MTKNRSTDNGQTEYEILLLNDLSEKYFFMCENNKMKEKFCDWDIE